MGVPALRALVFGLISGNSHVRFFVGMLLLRGIQKQGFLHQIDKTPVLWLRLVLQGCSIIDLTIVMGLVCHTLTGIEPPPPPPTHTHTQRQSKIHALDAMALCVRRIYLA